MYKKSIVVALLLGSSIFAMSTGAQAATPRPYPSTGAVVVAIAGTPELTAPGTPGTYTIRVVGENGNTATAQFVVTPVDANGNFITDAASSTDNSSPLLAIWISTGIVLFIVALSITLVTVRRKRLATN
jgi:hypothetical protein